MFKQKIKMEKHLPGEPFLYNQAPPHTEDRVEVIKVSRAGQAVVEAVAHLSSKWNGVPLSK